MSIEFFGSKGEASEYARKIEESFRPFRKISLRPIKVKITDERAVPMYGIRGVHQPDPKRGDVGYVIARSVKDARSWKLEGVEILG